MEIVTIIIITIMGNQFHNKIYHVTKKIKTNEPMGSLKSLFCVILFHNNLVLAAKARNRTFAPWSKTMFQYIPQIFHNEFSAFTL